MAVFPGPSSLPSCVADPIPSEPVLICDASPRPPATLAEAWGEAAASSRAGPRLPPVRFPRRFLQLICDASPQPPATLAEAWAKPQLLHAPARLPLSGSLAVSIGLRLGR